MNGKPQIAHRKWGMVLLICFMSMGISAAQTAFTGMPGLTYTPVATDMGDGEFVFGGSVLNGGGFVAKAFEFPDNTRADAHFSGYLTFSYLPRLIISLRGNGMPGAGGPGGTGPFYTDGMMSVQMLLARQGRFTPAIAVGLQDAYGFMLFNQAYTVATRDWPISGRPVIFSAGWGVDWYDRHIGTEDDDFDVIHYLIGPFFGAQVVWSKSLQFDAEYDTHSINLGARYFPRSWMELHVSTIGARGAGFALNLRWQI